MRRPYSILLQVGFAMPCPLPGLRCALAAPFRPYPEPDESGPPGGMLSVALSLKDLRPPPGVTRHLHSLEPGLSSPHRINDAQRSPDPLAGPR